ncbi:hypothetical protein Despr_2683 [Desulfobulbus propionicus DSM 2032]|uniref:Uncharacterized protein n=1 Tax=Desulfobulbus propionicus (strain ATCC 33891 / DSM 2032 / VKM B-1956 / 1pr3) TaxID=577650 RepID=A0A7U4DQ76_DESPD|nr:hypothetical protein [Desulfobulbus propionicus]ADW18819.1 hypothetical protein Despr_2683 [Desulfobulbus propionicus DSM 2032]
MIEIKTAAVDDYANQPSTEELVPGVYRDRQTGAVYVSDGKQTIRLEVTAE